MSKTKKVLKFLGKPYMLLLIMALLFAGLACAFMFQDLGPRPDIIFPMRLSTVITIAIVSVAVGYSTILFQTVANSRILTPGILGFENVYTFIQTALVFMLGTGSFLIATTANFIISVVLMVVFALLIFLPLLFGKKNRGIFFVLLLGVIIGQLFSALTTYMQFFINPDEFAFVQASMFASFEFPNMFLVTISAILVGVCLLAVPNPKKLDVLSLGKQTAIGLGINYKALCIRVLVIVSILVAVSTVTVGPMMFLGVLVANLTYSILRTYKHIYLIPGCILVTALVIMFAQYFTTHIFNPNVTLSVTINFIGGLFFLYLLLRGRKKHV